MSITYVRGNLFESPAQVLVNTVNTVGVMGKGVALEFKKLFPEMFEEYRRLCEGRLLKIGMLHIYRTPHKWVLNFPTKEHWRQPSRVEYIDAGQEDGRGGVVGEDQPNPRAALWKASWAVTTVSALNGGLQCDQR